MRSIITTVAAVVAGVLVGIGISASQAPPSAGRPIVEEYGRAMVGPLPSSLIVDPFYKKHTDALGIPILSSEKVPDAALLMARDIVIYMLAKRPDLRDAMIA